MTDLDEQQRDKMGQSITRGILVGVPAVLILLTIGIWLMTDNDLGDALATALLPGTLLGSFAGGFAGMAVSMD
jgi:hypothetical protein